MHMAPGTESQTHCTYRARVGVREAHRTQQIRPEVGCLRGGVENAVLLARWGKCKLLPAHGGSHEHHLAQQLAAPSTDPACVH